MTSDRRPFRVLKFGGTSLGSAGRIESIVPIIRDQMPDARLVLVVSAIGGITDLLIATADRAAAGDDSYADTLRDIRDRHGELAEVLVHDGERDSVRSELRDWLSDLTDLLHGVFLVRECTPRTRDRVTAFGELMSSALVAAALRRLGVEAVRRDSRSLIVTDATFGNARVDIEATEARVREGVSRDGPIEVVTGFIASTPRGETTTLGRSGSDYTAALLGAMLDADRVEIWTDVDGVMSADPRLVDEAFSLPALSYQELMELSHFGAKVVHTPSIHPARARGVPLSIRNSFNPSFSGTRVGPETPVGDRAVRGITSIDDIALLRLEGDGMIGVPGIAHRLFGALARQEISVVLITQASSEHSICFAVDPDRVQDARRCVDVEFALERRVGIVDELVAEEDLSIVAVVGAGMRSTPGIAGALFSVLGDASINVHAIAQGSSELNISVVVARADVQRALRTLHSAFFGGGAGAGRGRVGP